MRTVYSVSIPESALELCVRLGVYESGADHVGTLDALGYKLEKTPGNLPKWEAPPVPTKGDRAVR